jgi:hypothetical protein
MNVSTGVIRSSCSDNLSDNNDNYVSNKIKRSDDNVGNRNNSDKNLRNHSLKCLTHLTSGPIGGDK